MTKKIQHFLAMLLTVILFMSAMHAVVFGKEAISFTGSITQDKNEKIYRWCDDVNRVHYSDQRPFYDIPVHNLRVLNTVGAQTHPSETMSTKTRSLATDKKKYTTLIKDTY